MASPINERRLVDNSLTVTGTLPNAANTSNSNVIDLGRTVPFPLTEQVWLNIVTTTATGANSKNINLRVMDSADNSSFANVAVIANPVLRVTDNAGGGYPAGNVNIALPPTIRRYLKVASLGEANGGDASDGSFTVKLLF